MTCMNRVLILNSALSSCHKLGWQPFFLKWQLVCVCVSTGKMQVTWALNELFDGEELKNVHLWPLRTTLGCCTTMRNRSMPGQHVLGLECMLWVFNRRNHESLAECLCMWKTTLETNRLPAEATGALLFLELPLVCRASLLCGAAG